MTIYITCNTLMYCAMILFHCVVNNDPGVDKYTHEDLEANSGFSQRLIGLSQSTYLDKVLKKFKMD